MIRSMTGFGRAQISTEHYAVRAEARSLNNRSLRVTLRLPERVQGIETELEKLVRGTLSRGTIAIFVTFEDMMAEPPYVLDPRVIRYYRDAFAALGMELGLAGEVSIEGLAALPGALLRSKSLEDVPEELGKAVRRALTEALAEMVRAREEEGAFIWKDMLSHAETIADLLVRVEERIPRMVEEYRQRLSDRLSKLLEGVGVGLDDEDLRREIALFADRSDITEELTRMRSHLNMIEQARPGDEPFGRRLEFVTQEMFREANTMASKANDAEMVHDILDIKSEIEKLREQALNVE